MVSWMLLGGPAAALIFGIGVTLLGVATPGYSAVRQTVSELGTPGGKGRRALAGLNLIVAIAAIVFACGLASVAKHAPATIAPAYFVGLFAVLTVGLALFPSGHPLHNVIGLLQTVPFVGAPLYVAQGWRGLGVSPLISWTALFLLVVAMVLNLAPAFSPRLAREFMPVYGLLQRSIFVAWHGWCAVLGLLLFLHA